MDETSAPTRILDAAERLCQTRGFNGFSYRDLASIVGIRTASIHYHFPSKLDLGKAMITRYRHRMEMLLDEIERKEASIVGRLKRFVNALRETFNDEKRLCLCAVLAAESATISDDMRAEVRHFFQGCEAWMTKQLAAGRASGETVFKGDAETVATAMLSALEGAMMASRAFGDDRHLRESSQWFIGQLVGA